MRYKQLVALARMCARDARSANIKEVSAVLWKMALEYHDRATELGNVPDIGKPPSWLE